VIAQFAKQIADLSDPGLTALTFENNTIEDEESLCILFKKLAVFQKLESLNVRQNRPSQPVMAALYEGIQGKRELRVSDYVFDM
jgi:Ran GTPase-activating protein (RanGAP) involved in mRNA processing and transport